MGKYTIKDWQTEGQGGKAIVSMPSRPIVDQKNSGCASAW